MEQISKRCPRCGEIKSIASCFRNEPSRPRGIATYCRDCEPEIRREKYAARKSAHNEQAKAYQKQRPEKRAEWARKHALKKFYNLTPEQWEGMYLAQSGRCLICDEEIPRGSFHVDHDHASGAVRGLLCSSCNSGLGMFKDDIYRLQRAINYLERYVA